MKWEHKVLQVIAIISQTNWLHAVKCKKYRFKDCMCCGLFNYFTQNYGNFQQISSHTGWISHITLFILCEYHCKGWENPARSVPFLLGIMAIPFQILICVITQPTDKHFGLIMTLLCSLLHLAKPSPYYRPLHARNLTLSLSATMTQPWPDLWPRCWP